MPLVEHLRRVYPFSAFKGENDLKLSVLLGNFFTAHTIETFWSFVVQRTESAIYVPFCKLMISLKKKHINTEHISITHFAVLY